MSLLNLIRLHRALLPTLDVGELTERELAQRQDPPAREEIAHRRLKSSCVEWCRLCGFEPAAHHRLLIGELEKVARGETPRLAVFMPPGSAKSTYTSILFVPWYLANGGGNILAASHTTELARRWGRRVRNLIVQHSNVLRIALAEDSTAAERWSLRNGTEYHAAGVAR